MKRTVLHINIVNFYVSVARALNRRLDSYPVAVTSIGTSRRIIIDISKQAGDAGVRRFMPLDTARRCCPDLVALYPTPPAYDRAHKALMEEALRLSPRVEKAGPGHIFIDLTGTMRLHGVPSDIADRIRRVLAESYHLPPAVGVAANKLVSKVATRVIKPAGFCTVVHGCEQEFMAPLPIHIMPGIDPRTHRILIDFNIGTISDLLMIRPDRLRRAIGPVSEDIYRFSHGIDTSPVREYREPEPAIEENAVLAGQTNDDTAIERQLFRMISTIGAKLRRRVLGTQKLSLCITYADASRYENSVKTRIPVNGDITLFEMYVKLLHAAYTRRIRLSALSVRCSELSAPYGQLDLFDDVARQERLMIALDTVRGKFGTKSLEFGKIR